MNGNIQIMRNISQKYSQWANIFSKLTNTDSRMSVGMFLTLNFSPNMHVRINGTKYSTVNQVKLVEDSL